MTIYRDLTAARNVSFRPVIEIVYSGAALPLSGALVTMQVRLYAGADGDPIFEDASVNFTDAVDPDDPASRVLTLEPLIAKADLEDAAVPTGLNKPEVGEADRFEYEIKLSYADAAQDVLRAGGFYLEPGVDDT